MDFVLDEQQQLIADGADRFVRERYEFEARRALAASEKGYADAHWNQFAELGWLAMSLPEEHGGLGAGPVETMLLMEAFGRGLVLEPYLPTVVLGAGLIAAAGSPEQQAQALPAIAEGRAKAAFAYAEPEAGYALTHTAFEAKPTGEGWSARGRKAVVLGGADADWIVLLARTDGSAGDEAGLSLFLIPGDAPGLVAQAYPTSDGHRAADLLFDEVALSNDALMGEAGAGLDAAQRALDAAAAAVMAEALGAMEALNRATGQYLMQRTQFGRPIGSFQVLQHRMADMVIAAEEARSMVYYATMKLDDAPEERMRAVSTAKAKLGESARFVAREAVQLHGGMGVSDELAVGHYFKRIFMIEQLFGDTRYHRARLNALS